MKKYNKPELNVENILLNTEITNSVSSTLGANNTYGDNATDNVTFDAWKIYIIFVLFLILRINLEKRC